MVGVQPLFFAMQSVDLSGSCGSYTEEAERGFQYLKLTRNHDRGQPLPSADADHH